MPCAAPETSAPTAATPFVMSCGSADATPDTMPVSICTPLSPTCGSTEVTPEIKLPIASRPVCSIAGSEVFAKAATRGRISRAAAAALVGSSVSMRCMAVVSFGSTSVCSIFAAFTSTFGSAAAICSTRGRMFLKTVPAASATSVKSCPKSAFSSASPAIRFEYAPFIMPMDPEIVLAASACVVPAMPICVCTSWIAETISA